jgi:osmotically-inducible protein OsmY
MLRDTELQKHVIDELRWEPSVKDEEIAVAAKDGVVTLSGSVDTYPQRYNAVHAAERVRGVRAVADEITVRPSGMHERSDTEIAHMAAEALRWSVEVPKERVKAKVSDGWITLEGMVDWQYERRAAERAVRYLTGVKGIIDLVTLKPRASSYDVSQRIKDALRRNAEEDAAAIEVTAHDGKVTLKGAVRSWAERRDAEYAAWNAMGVTDVDDRITVTF